MNIKLNLIPALALLTVLTACVSEKFESNAPEKSDRLPSLSADALPGQLFVRFDPSVSQIIEKAGLTKSGMGAPATRSGLMSVDQVLDIVGGYEIERVFPVDSRTEETARHEGLHLWYIVRFSEEHSVEQVAADLSKLGEVSRVEYNRTLKRTPGKKAVPFNASAVSAQTTEGPDPLLKYQWHLVNKGIDQEIPVDDKPSAPQATFIKGADVGMQKVWDEFGYVGHPSIIVAVLDEGVCFDHPDLRNSMWINEGEELRAHEDNDKNGYEDDKYGYNFVQNTGVISTDSAYDTGHGSHVAGVIAAENNNGIGIGSVAGGTPGCPGVKIMSCQIFAGVYAGTLLDEVRAIKYAADNGAVVLQCSWGYISGAANPYEWSPQYSTDEEWSETNILEKKALDYFVHNAGSPDGTIEGGVVVFAAGNEYAPAASYPAAYPDYVSVAATAPDFTPAVYSNFGKGVTISAPGGDQDYYYEYGEGHDKGFAGCVLSTIPENAALEFDETISAGTEGSYAYMEGTSMACPHVSGVVALGLSYAARLRKHFKAEEIISLLYDSVYKTQDETDPFAEYWDFDNPKVFYKYVADLGTNHKKSLDLNHYKGKMGHGQVNAFNFLRAIAGDTAGVAKRFPNVFIRNAEAKVYDPAEYMEGSNYTVTVEDDSVAAAGYDSDSGQVTVTGLRQGQTKAFISNGTETHEFVITVRAAAGGNGWL